MTPFAALGPVAAAVALAADAAGVIALVWLGGQIMFGESQPFEIEALQVGAIGAVACLADRRAVRAFPIALIVYALAAIVSGVVHQWTAPIPESGSAWQHWFGVTDHFIYMLVFVFGASFLLRTPVRLAWFVVLLTGAITVLAAQLLFDRASSGFVYNRADIAYIASVSQWAGLHQFGLVLVTGLPLCLSLALCDSGRARRVSAMALSLFLILVAWFNGSRTAILLMAMTAIAMPLLMLQWRRLGWRSIAGLALIMSIAVASGLAVFGRTSAVPAVTSLTGDRAPIWRAAAQMFFDHPALGVGPGAFTATMDRDGYAARFLPWFPQNRGGIEQAHNWPLQVAAETGLIGLISLLWLFVWMWRASVRAASAGYAPVVSTAVGFALAAIFARCLFDNFMGFELTADRIRPFVWMFFAAAVAVHRVPRVVDEARI